MGESPISTDRSRAEVGTSTLQGERLTVAIDQIAGTRRHVAIRWPYEPPFSFDDENAPGFDGIDLTSREALALGLLLVDAHDRIERGPAAFTATNAREVIVGRVRVNRPGSADLVAVRIGRNSAGAAAIGIHYHRDGLDAEVPRMFWLSLRDASVFAAVLELLGADRFAGLVRRATALARSGDVEEAGQ